MEFCSVNTDMIVSWNKVHWYKNGAFSDSAVKFGGKLKKISSAQGWSTTIYHVGANHIEN